MRQVRVFWAILILLTSPLAADELRIGATLSLTGPYGTYGRQALHGMEMAVDEANAQGGVRGRKVRLIVEDFGTLDLKRAVTAARKLIDIDKVELFLPLIVEDSEVILPLTSKVPLFSMVAGCGARKCGLSMGPYNVRAASSHDPIVESLVGYVKSKGLKRSCVVAAESTYFTSYGEYIRELSVQAGQQVVYESVPLSNSEDYRDIATRFAHSKCEAIYSWVPIGSAGGFIRRVRESGSKALLLSIVETDDPNLLKAAGDAAEGVVFATFSSGSPEFVQRYQERYHEPPLRPAVPSYDGVKLLLRLVGDVGSRPKALLSAILKVQGVPATNGTVSYTPEGERLGESVRLMTIKGGVAVEAAPSERTN